VIPQPRHSKSKNIFDGQRSSLPWSKKSPGKIQSIIGNASKEVSQIFSKEFESLAMIDFYWRIGIKKSESDYKARFRL